MSRAASHLLDLLHELVPYLPVDFRDHFVLESDLDHEIPVESISQHRVSHSAIDQEIRKSTVVVRDSAGACPSRSLIMRGALKLKRLQ